MLSVYREGMYGVVSFVPSRTVGKVCAAGFKLCSNAFVVTPSVLFRKKLRAFRQWDVQTQKARETEQCHEQARLLVYAKDQRTVREKELELQLQLERQRSEQSVAKQGELVTALDAAQERVAELSTALAAQVTARQQLEASTRTSSGGGDLYEQLQREKERAVVLTAKYNTLKAQYDREVAMPQELPGHEGALLKPSRYMVLRLLSQQPCLLLVNMA